MAAADPAWAGPYAVGAPVLASAVDPLNPSCTAGAPGTNYPDTELEPFVAVDRIGVGPGELVYYITSREAALTLDQPFAAVDAGIVGKVDRIDLGGERPRAAER